MELNQFRNVDVVLDKANDNIIQRQTISAGDRDGRSLTLQVTNEGSIGEVPGLTANLLWTNHSSGLSDLTAFSVVDRLTSVFKIEYPQNMLTAGKVTAQIQLLHNGKVTHSKKFEIIVLDVAGNLKGVLQTAEYSALVTTLAKANEFEAEIAKKADKTQFDALGSEINVARGGAQTLGERLDDMTQTVDVALTVGEAGDFATLNDALSYLSYKTVKHKKETLKIEIKLLSGFVLREQILVDGQNLGHIKIISDDATVKIENVGFTQNIKLPAYGSYVETNLTAVFGANNYGVLPAIGCLFDMTGSTGISGVFVVANGGRVKIEKDCGCINAKGGVLLAYQNGSIEAMGAAASRSTGSAIQAFRDATVLFGGGDASYCQSTSSSAVYADVNSTINCDSANLSNATKTAAQIDQGSRATFVGADLSNAGGTALSVSYASQVSAKNANLSNANNYGVRAQGSSIVDVEGANCIDCDMAITAMTGSLVNASGIDATNYKTSGITSQSGATINIRGAMVQKIQGQNSATDVVVSAGGIINIDNVTAGSSPSQRNMITTRGILLDNAFVPDYGSDFGEEVEVALQSGWTGTLKVSKTSKNIVCLRGDLITGDLTINKIVALLPGGYRPTAITPLTVINNDNANRGQFGMHISTSGGIYLSEEFKSGAIHLNMMFKI